MSKRSNALADRLEKGAIALEAYSNELSEAEWQSRVPHDGRKVGVVVHHVATMYPLEIDLARTLAAGQPIEGVTTEVVDHMNAVHANGEECGSGEQACGLRGKNSAAAAAAVGALSGGGLDGD